MSPTTDLLDGLAADLDDAGIATYDPGGPYTDGDPPVVTIGGTPPHPDRAAALMAYPVDDDYKLSDSVVAVQVRTRGTIDPRTVERLADDVFDRWHGVMATDYGGVYVVAMWRQSGAQLGRDDSGRWERSDNYYLTIHRSSTHRE